VLSYTACMSPPCPWMHTTAGQGALHSRGVVRTSFMRRSCVLFSSIPLSRKPFSCFVERATASWEICSLAETKSSRISKCCNLLLTSLCQAAAAALDREVYRIVRERCSCEVIACSFRPSAQIMDRRSGPRASGGSLCRPQSARVNSAAGRASISGCRKRWQNDRHSPSATFAFAGVTRSRSCRPSPAAKPDQGCRPTLPTPCSRCEKRKG